jgi:hypothetical protein
VCPCPGPSLDYFAVQSVPCDTHGSPSSVRPLSWVNLKLVMWNITEKQRKWIQKGARLCK